LKIPIWEIKYLKIFQMIIHFPLLFYFLNEELILKKVGGPLFSLLSSLILSFHDAKVIFPTNLKTNS